MRSRRVPAGQAAQSEGEAGDESDGLGPGDGGATFEPDGHGGVTVLLHGHPQSHVDLDDPEHLAFEYVAQIALALDALSPGGPLAVTHVGGAGLTLPRYITHTRPGSPQIVLEPHEALTEAVRHRLPLPRGHRIRVRPQDGATGITALADDSADAVVLDAFDEGRVPAALAAMPFLTEVARVLRPGGLFLANIADEPGRRYVARLAAGCIGAGLGHLALLATHDILKGRRFGNSVLVASATTYDVDELRRAAARAGVPTGVRAGAELLKWASSTTPFTAGDAQPSPAPPDPGAWRAR